MPALLQLLQLYLQLPPQQLLRAESIVAQYVARRHEDRLVVHNDTRLRRKRYLAGSESIQRVDSLVGAHARRQVDHYLHLRRRIVVHLLHLNLALLVRLQYTVDEHIRGNRIGQLRDHDSLAPLVIVHPRTDAQAPAQRRVIISRHVDKAARGKVGINLEPLLLQYLHARLQQLAEIVGQNDRSQRYRDTLRTLRQQQRKLDRQRHRLLLAAVIRRLPLRRLRIEHHLLRELREARLDIAARSRIVARQYIAPVTLAVDQQLLLPQVHQRILDRRVPMRVVLHRVTHNIGHLREAAVVRLLHRVQDTPLHRLQAVVDVGHRAVQDDIGGIVNPIVAEHAVERQGRTLLFGGGGVYVLFHVMFLSGSVGEW